MKRKRQNSYSTHLNFSLKKKLNKKEMDGFFIYNFFFFCGFQLKLNERVERRRVLKFHPPVGQGVKMKPSICRVKKKGHPQNEEDQKYKNDEEISRKERRNRNERNRIIQHSTRPVNNNWSETV